MTHARRFADAGVTFTDMLIHRIATSEPYRCSPADVAEWPFTDLIVALLNLDFFSDLHQELQPKDTPRRR